MVGWRAAILTPDWPLPPGIRAAFSLRGGGVSLPPYDSLNLGDHVGDSPVLVRANRARLGKLLQLPTEPGWLTQVHGRGVVDLAATGSAAAAADAAIAWQPAQVCAVLVADCLPVLFAAKNASAVAAAHAGWRGLAAGVLEQAVATLDVPGAELTAWLGPCIRQPEFEVGAEVRAAFLGAAHPADASATAALFAPNVRGRYQCDLPALARLRLARLGLTAVSDCGLCTVADAQGFFPIGAMPRGLVRPVGTRR